MNCDPPGSSAHGILQARVLEWVAVPSSRGPLALADSSPPVRPAHHCSVVFVGSVSSFVPCSRAALTPLALSSSPSGFKIHLSAENSQMYIIMLKTSLNKSPKPRAIT